MRGIPIQGPFFYTAVVGIKKRGPKPFRNGRSNLQLFCKSQYVFVYVHMYVCMYVCVCMCICMYVHMYVWCLISKESKYARIYACMFKCMLGIIH